MIDEIEVPPPSVEIGGRWYPIVRIGNQYWLAENLDWKLPGIDIGINSEPDTPAAWYYNNNEPTYGESGLKYGLLYNWYCISVIHNSSALPNGWRVPSIADYNDLFSVIGGSNKSYKELAGSWANGSDTYGFNAPPSGVRWNGNFGRINMSFYSQASDSTTPSADPSRMWIDVGNSGFDTCAKRYAQSIRLVKDVT